MKKLTTLNLLNYKIARHIRKQPIFPVLFKKDNIPMVDRSNETH